MAQRLVFKLTASVCIATTMLSPLAVQARGLDDVVNGLGRDIGKVFDGDGNDRDRDQDNRRKKSDTTGGAAGCAVGGVAGALIGKSTEGKLALGAILCAVGWKLGSSLKGRDSERLTDKSRQMLAYDGARTETWVAPESRQRIQIHTGEARERSTNVPFSYDDQVQKPSSGTVVEAKDYVVVANRLNFRSSPREQSDNLIGYFNKGETVEVLGRTSDGKWALVGDRGVVVGYAAFRDGGQSLLLTPEQARAQRQSARVSKRARPKVVNQKGADLATAKPRVANPKKVKTAVVRASTECKAVTAQTSGKSDRRTGCALPNGQWAIA